MKLTPSRPDFRASSAIMASCCLFGAFFVIPGFAQEGDIEPVETVEIVEDTTETPPLAEILEPAPVLPEGVALDSEGTAYPEGGPAGLYNAIVDKQQKLGMTGDYDADGKLLGITYQGTNHGQQVALARLRENLERKLKKQGLLEDAPEIPELEETAESAAVEVSESPEAGNTEATEPLPVLSANIAADSEGNPYPEGGPAGLYNAITDKQQKLGMEGVYGGDGSLESVAYEGTNSGLQTALTRLRGNLEKKLKKLGLFDETPDLADTGEPVATPAVEELAIAAELGVSEKNSRPIKSTIEKSQKPTKLEKTAKLERVSRPEKVQRVEKPQRPEKITRVEKPQRPEKITRVEKPQRPEKITRVEKPQRPEKITRMEKPQRPEKPQKPDRPGRG